MGEKEYDLDSMALNEMPLDAAQRRMKQFLKES